MKKNKTQIVEREKESIVTVMVGSFGCSVPFYLTKSLTEIRLKTLVIDNTSENKLFTILKKGEDDEVVKRGNTFFIKNRLITKEDLKEWDKTFDEVIVLLGTNTIAFDRDVFDRANHFIFVTGYDRFVRDSFRLAMETLYSMDRTYFSNKEHTISMVWNDKCPCKVNEKDFESKCHIAVTHRYFIPMSDTNRKAYISLTENGNGNIKALTDSYKECIFNLANTITDGTKTKEIKKIIK